MVFTRFDYRPDSNRLRPAAQIPEIFKRLGPVTFTHVLIVRDRQICPVEQTFEGFGNIRGAKFIDQSSFIPSSSSWQVLSR
jgi:hypothetical protein